MAMAGPTVEFLGAVDDRTLRDLYRQARALVLPAEEDFGIAPVEAMACGRPTVALGRGGAAETVVPGVTGTLVAYQNASAFASAMDAIAPNAFDSRVLVERASAFGPEQFDSGFRTLLTDTLAASASVPC
jgi:glycosyltransferase involved in cell wall biosynthesis